MRVSSRHLPLLLSCLALAPLAGCDETEVTADAGALDLGVDTGSDAVDEADEVEAVPYGPRSHTAVVSDFLFAREEPSGVTEGFDLDSHQSRGADPEGCYTADMRAPDGTRGIDNQFARLLPTIEAVGGASIEGLSLEAINDGRLLIMITVEDLDDPLNDDDINVTIARATGDPFVGNDDRLEPGQTLARDESIEVSRVEGVELEDGWFTAGPFSLELTLQVFQFEISFNADDAIVRMELREDGSVTGFLSMGIPVQQIVDIASLPGTGTVGNLIADSAPLFADLLGESGECEAISVTVLLDTVPAFLFEE